MTITVQLNFKRKLQISQYINGQLAVNIQVFSSELIAKLSIMHNSAELAPHEII